MIFCFYFFFEYTVRKTPFELVDRHESDHDDELGRYFAFSLVSFIQPQPVSSFSAFKYKRQYWKGALEMARLPLGPLGWFMYE